MIASIFEPTLSFQYFGLLLAAFFVAGVGWFGAAKLLR